MERAEALRRQIRRELGWYLLAVFVPTVLLAGVTAWKGGLARFPATAVLGHLIWLPLCMCFFILLQAAYRAGRSIFVPALTHGALNQVGSLGVLTLFSAPVYVDWLHGSAGLAGLIAFIAPAIWVYLRRPDLLTATPLHDNSINGEQKP